ncbi:polysaccharide pyruvyl transferase family protein [Stutzerimonas stutzeri]|uniref:polysaccharide pyruvyl transferase family protein n=1 Tax=Stutzerimonas stutzeri TaxID=316 RepID=UPI003D31E489
MKIGILTYHFSDNFGALLQAYALRRWLIERGHAAEFINYHPSYVEQGGSLLLPTSKERIKANIKILYLYFANIQRKLAGNPDQSLKFEEFRRDILGVNGPNYDSLEKLRSAALDHDVMIAGSDQIWNPSAQKGLDPAYFLAFGNSRVRRLSYAASFGKDTLAPEFHDEARPLINRLDAISIREQSGVEIVHQLTGRQIACVPDPTLLHTQYEELLDLSQDRQDGHVFCYALRTAEGIRQVAEAAARKYQAQIISPYNIHRRWREIGTTVYPGPADWVRQIAHARCVVTNSFHGTVFSIIFRKPFVVVGLPGGKAVLNARAKNLLSSLGLMHRFLDAENASRAGEVLDQAIDWQSVELHQNALRAAGENFLLNTLSTEKL